MIYHQITFPASPPDPSSFPSPRSSQQRIHLQFECTMMYQHRCLFLTLPKNQPSLSMIHIPLIPHPPNPATNTFAPTYVPTMLASPREIWSMTHLAAPAQQASMAVIWVGGVERGGGGKQNQFNRWRYHFRRDVCPYEYIRNMCPVCKQTQTAERKSLDFTLQQYFV